MVMPTGKAAGRSRGSGGPERSIMKRMVQYTTSRYRCSDYNVVFAFSQRFAMRMEQRIRDLDRFSEDRSSTIEFVEVEGLNNERRKVNIYLYHRERLKTKNKRKRIVQPSSRKRRRLKSEEEEKSWWKEKVPGLS